MSTTSNSNSTTTQQQAQGSPFGQILGAGIGLLGAAGACRASAASGSLFSSMSNPGSGTLNAKGGQIKGYAFGGKVNPGLFGSAPVSAAVPPRPAASPFGQMPDYSAKMGEAMGTAPVAATPGSTQPVPGLTVTTEDPKGSPFAASCAGGWQPSAPPVSAQAPQPRHSRIWVARRSAQSRLRARWEGLL